MDDVIGVVIALIVAAAAFVAGGDIEERSWEKDCDAVGKHRVGDHVYVCHKEKP